MSKRIIITGASGFIGSNLANHLNRQNYEILGIDNFNNYYDVKLKYKRKKFLCKNIKIIKSDITNFNQIKKIFFDFKPNVVIHLAAQPGVKNSILNPKDYIDNNILGSLNILELSKQLKIKHLIMASTSSVYGNNKKVPYSESDNTSHPKSFYAASKKSMELLAYYYSNYWSINISILRFFTVYGPWGRPDMAIFKFTDAISNNKEIMLNNHGNMWRDFTYIDDLVESIYRLVKIKPKKLFNTFNIGSSVPVKISNLIKILEKKLHKKAKIINKPYNSAEMIKTYSKNDLLEKLIKYKPNTNLDIGLSRYIEWHQNYYEDS